MAFVAAKEDAAQVFAAPGVPVVLAGPRMTLIAGHTMALVPAGIPAGLPLHPNPVPAA